MSHSESSCEDGAVSLQPRESTTRCVDKLYNARQAKAHPIGALWRLSLRARDLGERLSFLLHLLSRKGLSRNDVCESAPQHTKGHVVQPTHTSRHQSLEAKEVACIPFTPV